MQIPMGLIHALKSGEVSLFTHGVKSLQLKVENKRIDVNLINKELLKDILRIGVGDKGKSPLGMLTPLGNIADDLKRNGLTITISHKDYIVLTLGSGAKSTLLQLITRTNTIEINNLSKLMELVL